MAYCHLTVDERNVIYRMRFQGYCDAEIARCLGRHRSTIGRECRRNADPEGRYDSGTAETWAHCRRRAHLRRPKTGHRRLMAYVGERLAERWSARPPADLEGLSLSHTTIYRWIWADPERTRQFRPFLRIARRAVRPPVWQRPAPVPCRLARSPARCRPCRIPRECGASPPRERRSPYRRY